MAQMTVFRARMVQTHQFLIALDDLEAGTGPYTIPTAVAEGARLYRELQRLQTGEVLNEAESSMLRMALDLVRARMRVFGKAL
jgi:hypothetical protein